MSRREKLLDIANRFNTWFSSHDTSPSLLESIVSRQVIVHVPFPGLSPDFEGLVEQYKRTITATKDVQITVKTDVVDEDNSLVAQFFEATGTQTGYDTPLNTNDQLTWTREWVGIPATGKPYKIAGLGIVKVAFPLYDEANL